MSCLVAASRSGAAGVGDGVDGVVGVVGPEGIGAGVLFRDVPGLEAPVTVVSRGRVLIGAAAFRTGVLANLCHLVAHVVAGDRSGIDTAALPVEELSLHRAAKQV